MSKRSIDEYMMLPYTIEFKQDNSDPEHPVWFANVRELPGCITEADSLEEAVLMIRDAMRVWLQGSLDEGLSIPEPYSEPEYSGKFSIRLPKSLHRDLVRLAEKEGVSLNQFVSSSLSRAVGSRQSS